MNLERFPTGFFITLRSNRMETLGGDRREEAVGAVWEAQTQELAALRGRRIS